MQENVRTPGFSEASGSQTTSRPITANQLFKKLGGEEGTGMKFNQWVDQMNKDGMLQEMLQHANQKSSNPQMSEGNDDEKKSAEQPAQEKRFLWMPMKYGIPVAIIGVAVIGYGIYRIYKHYKKAA